MPKVILNDLSSLANETSAIATINNNNTAIEAGFNNTLSLDGTSPNSMMAPLDMNSNIVYNLPTPLSNSSAATKGYVDSLAGLFNPANNNNNVQILGTLSVSGASTFTGGATFNSTVNFVSNTRFTLAPTPATDDGAALGTTALKWSDLFLASGGVINWNNGDVTITHASNTLTFGGATSGYFFDSTSVLGATSSIASAFGSILTAQIGGSVGIHYFNNDIFGSRLDFTKSRSGTYGTKTIVQNSDVLGEIYFAGADGTNFVPGAHIYAIVDGTPGTNDMPTKLIFGTTPDGSSNVVDRMSIDNTGTVAIAGVPVFTNIPQNSQSTAYTTVLADAQKHILHPTSDNNARTFTIAANASVAYPIGTAITFVNQINTVTIAINSDTMTLAGAGTTGSRTLAANGIATALKIASTNWIISGTGLT